jgi:hypothetical protein
VRQRVNLTACMFTEFLLKKPCVSYESSENCCEPGEKLGDNASSFMNRATRDWCRFAGLEFLALSHSICLGSLLSNPHRQSMITERCCFACAKLHRIAAPDSRGTASLSSSNRLVCKSAAKVFKPVIFPPDRARLFTIPRATGSGTDTSTNATELALVPVRAS